MLPILYDEGRESPCTTIKYRIYNIILVDESRSMHSIFDETLDGINNAIDNIKSYAAKCPAIEQYISLITFNGKHYRVHIDCRSANRASALKPDEFCPKSSTPLFDAIGETIMSFKDSLGPTDGVIVTIITDGEENSSMTYSGADIKNLVEGLSKKGWLFTFIGANQDVIENASHIGIRMTMSFDATPRGTDEMWAKEREAMSQFYDRIYSARSENPGASMSSIMRDECDAEDNFFERKKNSNLSAKNGK